jgi:hypothetical protein
MKFASFIPRAMKTSEVRVTSYENKVIRGTLRNPFFGADLEFHGLIQLLLLLEMLQDELEYPQRAAETRSFQDAGSRPAPLREAADMEARPVLATFLLSIYFRQNVSWQGTVLWAERGQSANFRSVLELIMLMDGALSAGEETKTEPRPLSTPKPE